MGNPITPIQQFSIATDMAQGNSGSEVGFNSVADAFVHASAEHGAASDQLAALAAHSDLSPQDLFQISKGMAELSNRVKLLSHMMHETTQGFRTLTQQQ